MVSLILLLTLIQPSYAGRSSYYIAATVRARELYKVKNFRPALAAAREAIRLYPEGWEGRYYASKMECEQKKYSECLANAQAGLNAGPPAEVTEEFKSFVLLAESGLPRSIKLVRGTAFYESWEVFFIGDSKDALYLKNPTVGTRQIPILAAKSSFPILNQFMKSPGDSFNSPLGYQYEFENVIDRACGYAKLKNVAIPTISIAELDKEFPLDTPSNAPQFSSRHSMIRFPELDKIEVTAAAISCKDPARKRFRLAQQRATLFHLENWQTTLEELLQKNREFSRETGSDPEALRVINSKSQKVMARSLNSGLQQLKAFDSWLESSEARLVLTKDQVKAIRLESSATRDRIRFKLDRLDRIPANALPQSDDLFFVKYLFSRTKEKSKK